MILIVLCFQFFFAPTHALRRLKEYCSSSHNIYTWENTEKACLLSTPGNNQALMQLLWPSHILTDFATEGKKQKVSPKVVLQYTLATPL